MPKSNVIVVEDDEDILELISYNLAREGFSVSGYLSGEEGLAQIRKQRPDIVLLDLMLPGVDGLTVCKTIKSDPEVASVPIIMISAKGSESDIIRGLELGADDYITKPFSPKILISRTRAILRRYRDTVADHQATLDIHQLNINPGKHLCQLAGAPLELTKDEFQLLLFFARHPGWVFTRYQIVDDIKGEGYVVTERAVDVRIAGLRKKLGVYSDYIETVRGVGYRFKDL